MKYLVDHERFVAKDTVGFSRKKRLPRYAIIIIILIYCFDEIVISYQAKCSE